MNRTQGNKVWTRETATVVQKVYFFVDSQMVHFECTEMGQLVLEFRP